MPGPRFVSWRRPALLADAQFKNGRLHTAITPMAVDSAHPEAPVHGLIDMVLRSPADIAALTVAAIRHRAPAPGVMDAEDTKFAHVDFRSPDLLWRYATRTSPSGDPLPWLALVVASTDEVTLKGPTLDYSSATTTLLAMPCHRLSTSSRAAHLQVPAVEDDPARFGEAAGDRFCRLLCLRELDPQTAYTAMVLPAVNLQGAPMWDENGKITNDNKPIPVFDSWTFHTGEGGDFETLAAALWMPDPQDVGRAELSYRFAGQDRPAAADTDITLEVRGALSSLKHVVDPLSAPLLAVTADLRSLTDIATEPGTPELIGLPRYGQPWVNDPEAAGPGWLEQLHVDPRERIHAGTGTLMGVEAQDELMRAATEQAGALREAAARIAQLAAGLELGGRTWARALSADPAERMRTLGPMTARLVADDGSIVLDSITDDRTNLMPELFTGAGQRLLRRATTRRGTPLASSGVLLGAINEGQPASGPGAETAAEAARGVIRGAWESAGVPRDQVRALRAFLADARTAAINTGTRFRASGVSDPNELAGVAEDLLSTTTRALQHYLPDVENACNNRDALARGLDVFSVAARAVGATDRAGFFSQMVAGATETPSIYQVLQKIVIRCLTHCQPLWPNPGDDIDIECTRRAGALRHVPTDLARPVHLDALAAAVGAVLDPRGESPPAKGRITARVRGLDLTRVAPPRYPLGLDFPTWSLLKRYAPDWLLPGADGLQKNSVTALKTNPAFIDDFLLGINTQFLAEARWRGLPTDPWGTPLCMFFGPADPFTHKRARDIVPISAWEPTTGLGDRSHQATQSTAAEPGQENERLVIIFNSSLFRRYPSTVVYLHKDPPTVGDAALGGVPQLVLTPTDDEELRALMMIDRRDFPPSFAGSLGPDLVFFGFDIAPDSLDDYWIMLDEPPTELRFRVRDSYPNSTDGTDFAVATIDHPTRVAISGRALREWSGGQEGGLQ